SARPGKLVLGPQSVEGQMEREVSTRPTTARKHVRNSSRGRQTRLMGAAPMPGSSTSKSDPVRKLLVRGVNWLGDAVMTTPGLCRLREHFPAAQISLLTPAWLAP